MNSITLYELNNIVHQAIENILPDTYWIHAEISELHVNRHCYLELVQKDEHSNYIIAKARGQVWANRWYLIKSYFEKITRQPLCAGMQVLIQVEVTFHELYGYSLSITDIDPTYTLGDIARRRLEIIQTLKDEGVFDMNKELPLPRLLQRIAIISSATAAGFGDFCDQLLNNKHELAFTTKLFPATMQGNDVEQSIIHALESIAKEIDKWDIVVIIRGGGSTTDLSGFDSLALAENVAQFPIPIITGIGHERDDTIIDLVSHTRVKTPTAAAEFLIHHQELELAEIESLKDRMSYAVTAAIQRDNQRLIMLTSRIPAMVIQRTSNEKNNIEMTVQRLHKAIENRFSKEQHHLEILQTKMDSADPQRILNLGFSITRINGKAIQDASSLQKGQLIETTLQNGNITSIIQ